MKLLLHPSLPGSLAPQLAEGLHAEVTHWNDVGALEAQLSEILSFAMDGGFVVVAGDVGLAEMLLAKPINCPSVLQVRCGTELGSVASEILSAITQASE